MHYEGFLENIYLGNGRIELEPYTRIEDNPKTELIIKRYRQAIKAYPPDALERGGQIPEPLWKSLKDIGIFGLSIPEEYGGQGFSVSQYLRIVQEMARTDLALALVPLAHLSIGLKGIQLFGTEEQKRKYLTPAASGEMIFAYALTEPHTGSDAKRVETQAFLSADGSHYILNGTKAYITNGNYAGGLTVFAQMGPEKPGHMGAFIVETGWDGVKVGRDMNKMGLKISSTASISFKDVRVPTENLLGKPGDGFKIAMTILNYGRLGMGAGSLGVMEQSLRDMMNRASGRKQFGRPIKEFELIQEKIVAARVHSTLTEALTYSTAVMLERNPLANVAMESSHCKLFGTSRAWSTLNEALQVAGGAGYISTQPYEKRVRDSRVTTVFEGTTEIHSIYPPLFLVRKLSKWMATTGKGRLGKLLFLLKGLLFHARMPVRFNLRFSDAAARRAARTAKRAVRAIRRMIYGGLILYGKSITEREFFLRRITNMSLAFLSLTTLLAGTAALTEKGASDTGDDADGRLQILDYTVRQLKAVWRENTRIGPNGIENLHRVIMRRIDNEWSSTDNKNPKKAASKQAA